SVEAWYPGIGGAQALANLLFGKVNFSAKLPATFPRSESQLPHSQVTGIDLPMVEGKDGSKTRPPFKVDYNKAGARVGYKWFESKNLEPLFPFGFGLSYTRYAYSDLSVDAGGSSATLTVKNTGQRAGTEI